MDQSLSNSGPEHLKDKETQITIRTMELTALISIIDSLKGEMTDSDLLTI